MQSHGQKRTPEVYCRIQGDPQRVEGPQEGGRGSAQGRRRAGGCAGRGGARTHRHALPHLPASEFGAPVRVPARQGDQVRSQAPARAARHPHAQGPAAHPRRGARPDRRGARGRLGFRRYQRQPRARRPRRCRPSRDTAWPRAQEAECDRARQRRVQVEALQIVEQRQGQEGQGQGQGQERPQRRAFGRGRGGRLRSGRRLRD
ncbi:hypothetical protein Golomagni_06283 [Golovinomyces magnicellulatus]|nr:hypothetical protein Golomagni_06283 [Golovinomyces magnicellulatus]